MALRKIVFRGKSLKDGEWYFGNLFVKDTIGRTHVSTPERGCLIIDPNTVGQFTGMRDKNGKEIYEDDILDVEGEAVLYVVEWHDAGLKARQVSNRSTIGLSNWNKWISVIGNVHDNLELLKGGKNEKDRL